MATAVNKVFAIAELVHLILEKFAECDPRTAIAAQRVSRNFQYTVNNSKKIQNLLWLTESEEQMNSKMRKFTREDTLAEWKADSDRRQMVLGDADGDPRVGKESGPELSTCFNRLFEVSIQSATDPSDCPGPEVQTYILAKIPDQSCSSSSWRKILLSKPPISRVGIYVFEVYSFKQTRELHKYNVESNLLIGDLIDTIGGLVNFDQVQTPLSMKFENHGPDVWRMNIFLRVDHTVTEHLHPDELSKPVDPNTSGMWEYVY